MKAIVYMLRKTIKNGIIDILHHPMQLIVYLFIALTTVSGVITAMTSNISEEETHFDFRILQGAYLLILYFISVPIMLKGTNASTTFFKMSDVANVFTAPISEKKILIWCWQTDGNNFIIACMLRFIWCNGSSVFFAYDMGRCFAVAWYRCNAV